MVCHLAAVVDLDLDVDLVLDAGVDLDVDVGHDLDLDVNGTGMPRSLVLPAALSGANSGLIFGDGKPIRDKTAKVCTGSDCLAIPARAVTHRGLPMIPLSHDLSTRLTGTGRPARCSRLHSAEEGVAVLIALIALSIFALIGLYATLNATTSVRVSDNYESEARAKYAGQAGLSHARVLLRGLLFNDLLKGPDGVASTPVAQARSVLFRLPVPWATARSLSVANPAPSLTSFTDDGLMSTGAYGGTGGTPLVPLTGLAQQVANPYGSGSITISRYFVKVTDNNGAATELAADAADNPFLDGDNIVVVRSMGVAQTIREVEGGVVRRNSVAAYEACFKRRYTFDLSTPLLIEGDAVLPSAPQMFNGTSFNINGGTTTFGIGTIDTNTTNGVSPLQQISSQLGPRQPERITGIGATPSMQDVTGQVAADPDKAMLRDPNFLYNFATTVVPGFADNYYATSQRWAAASAPDLGYYDITKPPNDTSQRPKTTYVGGDLYVSGNLTGGGLLVVTGKLSGNGRFIFNGLILVIGTGDVDLGGLNIGLNGGMFVVNVTMVNGVPTFGTPKVTVAGQSDITISRDAISMGMRLIPPQQLGWREIKSNTDQ